MVWIGVAIVLPLFVYVLAALFLGWLPVNRDFRQRADGVDIYVRSNGVHTDIVLPVQSTARDWRGSLEVPGLATAPYIAFGWGDRAFYLETKEWADLRLGNALRAVAGLDSSVMHISSEGRPRESADTVRVRISGAQLAALTAAIDARLVHDGQGRASAIAGAHYGGNDAFFPAQGRYSMFMTCNEWVRATLSSAGIRTAVWAPFSTAVLYQLRQVRK
ncbi:MAG: TIGR02117 family protein [Burkholderiales bacterium]|nr:TIGR02117 family protein [Burkholderiales bacterium]